MKYYRAYNINWDTDGEKVDLPSELNIALDDDADIAVEGSDALSDKIGWCVNHFDYKELFELEDKEAEQVGQRLVKLLGLKVDTDGRVHTDIGTKTPIGLARTVDAIMTRS